MFFRGNTEIFFICSVESDIIGISDIFTDRLDINTIFDFFACYFHALLQKILLDTYAKAFFEYMTYLRNRAEVLLRKRFERDIGSIIFIDIFYKPHREVVDLFKF